MSSFNFSGNLPASKSILNRLYTLGFWSENIHWFGDSNCDDVKHMRKAVSDLKQGKSEIYVGDAAAVLRFVTLLASRLKGKYRIAGSQALFKRPQQELVNLLEQLGVHAELFSDCVVIEGQGWNYQKPISVDVSGSSQFISALILNSVNLEKDLIIKPLGELKSGPYLDMTINVATRFGLMIEDHPEGFFIEKGQDLVEVDYVAELDFSSAAAVWSMAAVGGKATIELGDFDPNQTDQADFEILDILISFGADISLSTEEITVEKADLFSPEQIDFKDCPDLFPVVAALASLAEGRTELRGAPHLRHKESDRIAGVKAILDTIGVEALEHEDGLTVVGRRPDSMQSFNCDVKKDHRLLMAVAVLNAGGWRIKANDLECINKSFPEFTQIAEGFL